MFLFLRRENLVENTLNEYGCTQNMQPLYDLEHFYFPLFVTLALLQTSHNATLFYSTLKDS